MGEKKLKVGDWVVLLKRSEWFDAPMNPKWGGECGHIAGRISAPLRAPHRKARLFFLPPDKYFPYSVRWENGKVNQYHRGDLKRISNKLVKIYKMVDAYSF